MSRRRAAAGQRQRGVAIGVGTPAPPAPFHTGCKMVNYTELPYLILAAIKELKAENDLLKAQVASLADRLARLEKRR